MDRFSDFFTSRQLLTVTTFVSLAKKAAHLAKTTGPENQMEAVQAILGMSINRLLGRINAMCWWRPQADQEKIEVSFSGQTIPMKWDFAEGCPLTTGTAGWDDSYAPPVRAIENLTVANLHEGVATISNATSHPLPDDAAYAFITDPPYYDAVPYAALSDFFYVWLKRTVPLSLANYFSENLSPKDGECIVDDADRKTVCILSNAWQERWRKADAS